MRLLILDRDGVINQESDRFIKRPEEWIPIPGSLEAVARANAVGYRVVVVSNQSGLARGIIDVGQLHLIHQKMHQRLAEHGGRIEAVFFCPHGPGEGCACRKPRPGLFRELSERLHLPLEGVSAVGDRLTDIQAARAAGTRPILVETGRGRHTRDANPELRSLPVYEDLAAVIDELCAPGPGR